MRNNMKKIIIKYKYITFFLLFLTGFAYAQENNSQDQCKKNSTCVSINSTSYLMIMGMSNQKFNCSNLTDNKDAAKACQANLTNLRENNLLNSNNIDKYLKDSNAQTAFKNSCGNYLNWADKSKQESIKILEALQVNLGNTGLNKDQVNKILQFGGMSGCGDSSSEGQVFTLPSPSSNLSGEGATAPQLSKALEQAGEPEGDQGGSGAQFGLSQGQTTGSGAGMPSGAGGSSSGQSKLCSFISGISPTAAGLLDSCKEQKPDQPVDCKVLKTKADSGDDSARQQYIIDCCSTNSTDPLCTSGPAPGPSPAPSPDGPTPGPLTPDQCTSDIVNLSFGDSKAFAATGCICSEAAEAKGLCMRPASCAALLQTGNPYLISQLGRDMCKDVPISPDNLTFGVEGYFYGVPNPALPAPGVACPGKSKEECDLIARGWIDSLNKLKTERSKLPGTGRVTPVPGGGGDLGYSIEYPLSVGSTQISDQNVSQICPARCSASSSDSMFRRLLHVRYPGIKFDKFTSKFEQGRHYSILKNDGQREYFCGCRLYGEVPQ